MSSVPAAAVLRDCILRPEVVEAATVLSRAARGDLDLITPADIELVCGAILTVDLLQRRIDFSELVLPVASIAARSLTDAEEVLRV